LQLAGSAGVPKDALSLLTMLERLYLSSSHFTIRANAVPGVGFAKPVAYALDDF